MDIKTKTAKRKGGNWFFSMYLINIIILFVYICNLPINEEVKNF